MTSLTDLTNHRLWTAWRARKASGRTYPDARTAEEIAWFRAYYDYARARARRWLRSIQG